MKGKKTKTFKKKNDLTNKVKKVVNRQIAKITELKFFDTKMSSKRVQRGSNPQAVTCLTLVAQGLLDENRVGDKLTLTSLNMRITVQLSQQTTAISLYSVHRIIILQYHPQYDCSVAIPLTYFMFPSDTGQEYTRGQYTIDRKKDFSIIYDKTFSFYDSNAGGSMANKFHGYNISLKRAQKDVQYDAASASTMRNSLWCYVLGPDDNAVTNPVTFGTWRIRFRDA